ncbi:magnesium transporter CorA [Deinococcus irradiatisoli]|uniref:Magnesium transporter CorA n=1 Tax=Deinococcus irradiatisoli TaxID=2202254 RepID=A0A2Z3JJB5_9DEIO|nr:magnesium transporter CorA family protein [Deinococcus irradiatisoli]AWN24076.1 magnesium transporter CorA [Deinococcus irradiatisoli]
MTIRAFLYDADGTDQAVELGNDALSHLSDRQLLWIDITGEDPNEIERIGSVIHLHRESIKNLLNPIGRPRLDQFKDYFQINVVAIAANKHEGETSFRTIPLDFFAGPNYVVTIHVEALQFLHDFDDRVRENSGLGALDSATFLAALLDWHISSYFRVLESFEETIDDLDEEILLHPTDREFLGDLVTLRRRVGELRRTLAPHREVFSSLARPDFQGLGTTEAGPAFRSLFDRFERAMDAAEKARELVIGSFDLYMAGTSRKTNDAVQVLTIVTVSLGVIGAVAGVMGTNFQVDFFKAGLHGFLWMVLGMLALIALVLFVARRNKWI